MAQREALDKLHRQVRVALKHAGVEDLHHVGVRQVGQRLELACQPPGRSRIERGSGGQELQCHGVSRSAILRAIDRPCSTAPDRFQDAVGANDLWWHEVRDPRKLGCGGQTPGLRLCSCGLGPGNVLAGPLVSYDVPLAAISEGCLQHLGKYQLVRKLAVGGMAEVYLAKAAGPMGFEKSLVVKRILPSLAAD